MTQNNSKLTKRISLSPPHLGGEEMRFIKEAIPVFIDAEPESWNMSPAALERAFADAEKSRKLPKAVIVVNLYGQSADMTPLLAVCDHYGVPIIEDAAESFEIIDALEQENIEARPVWKPLHMQPLFEVRKEERGAGAD